MPSGREVLFRQQAEALAEQDLPREVIVGDADGDGGMLAAEHDRVREADVELRAEEELAGAAQALLLAEFDDDQVRLRERVLAAAQDVCARVALQCVIVLAWKGRYLE